jgi:hypothetical protein
VKIDGTINGKPVKTVSVYREHVENAFDRQKAKIA